MKTLAMLAIAWMLVSCGGGSEPIVETDAPRQVKRAAMVAGASRVAVRVYQALYGMAPGYNQLAGYTAQANTDVSAFARGLARDFSNTQDQALALAVLTNVNITTTSVDAVYYSLLLDALGQVFAAYGPESRGLIVLNLTNILTALETDLIYGTAAIGFNRQVSANYDYGSNAANTSAALVPLPSAQRQLGGSIQGKSLDLLAEVTSFAGGSTPFVGPMDGTGAAAWFLNPTAITTDGTNLYVADTSNNKIRKINIATGAVSTFAGSGAASSLDGTGISATFWQPGGIVTDGTNLYVTENAGNRVRKIVIATGVVSTVAGSTRGSVDGVGSAARFSRPIGITTDGISLYVVDNFGFKVRKVVISTGEVSTFAGSGSAGAVDAVGTAASFTYPSGITTDGTNLYVADSVSNRIRKIVISTRAVTTLAGSAASGAADGTGSAATFFNPAGVATDGINLYVGDTYNHKIRRIVIATGAVTTIAGAGVIGAADGLGAQATFYNPNGVTTDGKSLYVVDSTNTKIRRIH